MIWAQPLVLRAVSIQLVPFFYNRKWNVVMKIISLAHHSSPAAFPVPDPEALKGVCLAPQKRLGPIWRQSPGTAPKRAWGSLGGSGGSGVSRSSAGRRVQQAEQAALGRIIQIWCPLRHLHDKEKDICITLSVGLTSLIQKNRMSPRLKCTGEMPKIPKPTFKWICLRLFPLLFIYYLLTKNLLYFNSKK